MAVGRRFVWNCGPIYGATMSNPQTHIETSNPAMLNWFLRVTISTKCQFIHVTNLWHHVDQNRKNRSLVSEGVDTCYKEHVKTLEGPAEPGQPLPSPFEEKRLKVNLMANLGKLEVKLRLHSIVDCSFVVIDLSHDWHMIVEPILGTFRYL
jgi:hypothetical protein